MILIREKSPVSLTILLKVATFHIKKFPKLRLLKHKYLNSVIFKVCFKVQDTSRKESQERYLVMAVDDRCVDYGDCRLRFAEEY